MPEKVSARGLLEKLGFRSKKPAEVQPEISAATPPEPAATEAPPAQELAPVGELPDWLRAPSAFEPTPTPTPEAPEVWISPQAPMPAPEAPSALPTVEAPVAPSVELPAPTETAAEVEKSPEQLAIEQFEEALLAADDALAKLRVGESLNETQLWAAKAAAATANGLIRNLPEHYLKVLLASRRLGENQEYTRLDFQKDMMAAIRVFSQANKG